MAVPPLPGVPQPAAPAVVNEPTPLASVPAAPRKPVPMPGQIEAPPPAPVETPQMAAAPTVSPNAPPPVGSFGSTAVPTAPNLPGGGMKEPAIPNFVAAAAGAAAGGMSGGPSLPGGGMPMPKIPVIDGSGTQIAPDLNEKPALPGSGKAAPLPMPLVPETGASMLDARRDVNGLLASAKELRGLGNTQDAMNVLRQADLVSPANPAVMAEMAEIYEQMGLNQKAIDQWRGIQLQGAAKAGQYYDLAQRRLGNVPGADSVAVPTITGTPVADSEKRLRLGACQVVRDFAIKDGERYVLRVPINRTGNKSIDPNAIDLKTFFYHRQGTEVKLDNTTELSEDWKTQPVDWNSSDVEVVDVIYTLPPPTPQEVATRTHKTYHGYMLHLYYDNKLQDVVAEPRELLEQAQLSLPLGTTSSGPNPLLPPSGR